MATAKDTKEGGRSIGLATEHRLPEAYKARTDTDAGTVEIRKQAGRSLDVAINSFASVANVLATFSTDGEPSLKPEHTIRIVDDFTGKEVTITANTFVDVAAAFQVFLVEKGRYLPSAPERPAAEEPAAKTVEPPAPAPVADSRADPEKPAQEEPAKKVAAATKASAKKKAPAKSAAAPKATRSKEAPQEKASKPEPKSEPQKSVPAKKAASKSAGGTNIVAPEWARDLPLEIIDESGSFRMEARSLSLTKDRAKTVEGVADGSSNFPAFGYEVFLGGKPGGKHVGWVIVEDAKSWVVTGFGDLSPSKHANLSAASIRIRITNLPQIT